MRRFLLAVFVAAATPLLMGAGQPAPQRHIDLSESDRNELDAISGYLNGIVTLKGGFIQVEPSGAVAEGRFYLAKPGKMRFEYRPPSPTLIVSDGQTVAVANLRLNTVNNYPLADTPLAVILGNKVDIRHNPQFVGMEHQQGSVIIHLRTSTNRTRANLSLMFSEPEYELLQWSIVDAQGLTTIVSLRDQQPGAVLSPALFVLPQPRRAPRPPG